jgi:predicted nucleic acid-binding Zn ribbon protein
MIAWWVITEVINLKKKCETCGREIDNSEATHCSDDCLFQSIKNSQPFMLSKEDSTVNSG